MMSQFLVGVVVVENWRMKTLAMLALRMWFMWNVDNADQPNIDAFKTKFGMVYTTAYVIKPKLAKILNDIQAPKTMYLSILQWGHEAYTHGYDFVPHHGNKESLVSTSSLQTQLCLEHF